MRRRLLVRATPEGPAGLDPAAVAPFVDVMTLLLVVFLRGWSAEVVPADTDPARLVRTAAVAGRAGAHAVRVEADRLAWDDVVVGPGAEGARPLRNASPDGTVGPPDATELAALRARALAGCASTGLVEVVPDARVPWPRLRAVLGTLAAAGCDDLALVGRSASF
jgi:hypothetical protein